MTSPYFLASAMAFLDHAPVSMYTALPFFIRFQATAANCRVAPPWMNSTL